MHNHARTKTTSLKNTDSNNLTQMNETNSKFKTYCECLKNGNAQVIEQNLKEYQSARKSVTHAILQSENSRWKKALSNKNSKELWSCVDWKGSMDNKIKINPSLNELKTHFEHIYTADDKLESIKIDQLSTQVYVPTLDDPIDG